MHSYASDRYATAYFNVVREENAFEMVDTDAAILKPIAEKYRGIFVKLNSPVVSIKDRMIFLGNLFLTREFHKITKNLLSLLAQYGQLNLLYQILDGYSQLHSRYLLELVCEVASVKALKSADLAYIKECMEKHFQRKIIIKSTIDESLLGGLLIKTSSFVLDGSLANQLKSLEFTLKDELN